jgi:PAS domain S-box-containing protein
MISVLHIDDEQDFLDLTRAFLVKGGDIRLEGVTSAEQALERLKETSYDAIVSDYQMAGMDGISLLKDLRARGDRIPFIILTGRGREQVAIEALNSGADFYLQKGTDPKVHFIELRNLILQAVTRRKAVEDLRRSEEWYRNLAEASQDLIYIIDRDDNVVYLNTRALELLGKRIEEVVGRPRALLFPPAADERMRKNLATVFSDTHPLRVENRIPFGERETWQDTTLIPLRNAGGAVTWVMGISRDITERKQIEDALRESEGKYRNLVERAHDGIIVIQDGVMKFCNRRTAEMWGGGCEEIMGRPYKDFVDPSEFPRLRENYERRMAGKEVPGRYDTRLMRKDGTSFPVDLNGGSIIYEGRLADLIVFRDNTERKIAEEALRTVNRKLNLLSSVTRHDMLNQLMSIVGYQELALSSENLAEVKQLVDMAGRAAVTMRHQIEFTRQYQDVGIHSPVWQDLKDVIARASSGIGPRNTRILLEIDPVRIFADPLLERVFANLIDNAISHGEKVTTIRFSTRRTDAGLTILCEDDGAGIPAQEKEKIFSPGYGRKTGYGLFLVREILGITGATIQEIGQEGKGALFEIAVPRDAYQVRE